VDPTNKLGNYNVTINNGTLTIQYASGGTCNGDVGHQVLQPINVVNANYVGMSVFKLGSTVPVKFRVCDANGNSVGSPTPVVTSFTVTAEASQSVSVNETTVSLAADTAFRWDATAQQWVYNLSTKGMSTNMRYHGHIALNDGSAIDFYYGLR
jgi:hypothetical protein